MKKFDEIADFLGKKLDKKAVLKDALGEISTKNVEKIHEALFVKKEKPKIKQKYGCYEMFVGKECIPIR